MTIRRSSLFMKIEMNWSRARANIEEGDVLKMTRDFSLQTFSMQPMKEPSGSNVLKEHMSRAEAILSLTSWLEGHVQDLVLTVPAMHSCRTFTIKFYHPC